MKFELSILNDYSDNALIEELRRVSNIIDSKKLSVKTFDLYSKVHSSTIRRRFGSWKKALDKANLNILFDDSNFPKSKVEIIEELRRVQLILGNNLLTRDSFNEYSKYSYSAVRTIFDSWADALKEAGLKQSNLAKRYTDEECFENLLNIWTYYGRQPTYQEMKQNPSKVGAKAYLSRWGSWSNALIAFVNKINETTQIDENKVQEVTVERNTLPEEDKRDIKLGLRYDVLKRDFFKCVLCGTSPAVNPTTILHIDHIVPFSKGGKTEINNLRTLCKDCNLGKSNKI